MEQFTCWGGGAYVRGKLYRQCKSVRKIKSDIRGYKNRDYPSRKRHFQPATFLSLSNSWRHNRGRGGGSAHNKENEREDEEFSVTDMAQNVISTTSIDYLLDQLTLFI